MRHFVLLFTLFSLPAFALERLSTSPIAVYGVEEEFEDVMEDVQDGILAQGMTISNIAKLGAMLARTAKDLGFAPPYEKAQAIEFCSAAFAHRMAALHPANLASCPMVFFVYTLKGEDRTYIAFRRPAFLGEGEALEKALFETLEGILEDAFD
ncbi:DUF302 domain-containing protein [Candidatus Parcubacteria bacterium]|nr:MAG: DUF302 domain-containing protein [Candidatus Parcubacteria bacterium]